MERWKSGKKEEWKDVRMERWKCRIVKPGGIGKPTNWIKMERWKNGKKEGWKVGRLKYRTAKPKGIRKTADNQLNIISKL
jgi:hypothetical protein